MIPIIENELVKKSHLLTSDEYLTVLGFSEVAPGAISIKFATYTGYKIAGVWGILVANLANSLSPIIITTLAVVLYWHFQKNPTAASVLKGVKLAVIGLIFGVAWKMGQTGIVDAKGLVIASIAFISFYFFNLSPVSLMAGGAIAGLVMLK